MGTHNAPLTRHPRVVRPRSGGWTPRGIELGLSRHLALLLSRLSSGRGLGTAQRVHSRYLPRSSRSMPSAVEAIICWETDSGNIALASPTSLHLLAMPSWCIPKPEPKRRGLSGTASRAALRTCSSRCTCALPAHVHCPHMCTARTCALCRGSS